MRYLLSIFLLVIIGCLTFSGQLYARSQNFKFYNVNELYGISLRQATSVCKDDNGFIWAATKGGILRLTGSDYRIYQLPFESSNVMMIKLVFAQGTLWAYSNNGQIFQFDTISDKFILKFNLGNHSKNIHLILTSVLFQSKDVCWMATSDGLVQCNIESDKIEMINSEYVMQLAWSDSESFFVVSNNSIERYNTKARKSEVLFTGLSQFSFATFSLSYNEKNECLWLGSNYKGLFYFDLKKRTVSPFQPANFPVQPVMDIVAVDSKTLFVGIDGQGLWNIDQQTMSITQVYKDDVDNPNALRGNGVYDIFHDTETNRVWVCTYSGGLSYFDLGSSVVEHITHQVNQTNSLKNNNVNCILEDSENNLWFGTDNGISVWKVNEQKWFHLFSNSQEKVQVFLTLCEDDKGQIWAGTFASGVYVLDKKAGRQIAHYSKNIQNSPLSNDYIFSIYRDFFEDIWLAGIDGEIVRYNSKNNQFKKYPFQPVNKIIQYSDSLMLLACSYGVMQLNKNTGNYTLLVDKYIVNDVLVHKGVIWFGTVGNGMVAFNPATKELKQYSVSNGLLSNHVNSIVYADDYFWVGTENGMCRFSPENESVVTFSNYLPLSATSFNNAYCMLSDGRLAMGTNNGAVIFSPSTLKEESLKSRIFIQNLFILGRSIRNLPSVKLEKPIDQLEKLKLKFSQNSIMTEVLPVGGVTKAKFSWKLDGLDENWTQPSNHRLISYNNIPFNNYVLRIRMYDNSLSHIIAERSLQLKITPPFWATWWFFVTVFVLVSLLIYAILWNSINRLKQQHSEEKVRFFTNTAHDIRTSLTLIKAPVEELKNETNLSERGNHYVQMANEQAKHLNSVVNQLMDFQKADMGKEQFKPVMVDLPAIIGLRVDMVESVADVKSIKLVKFFHAEHYETAVDVMLIEKVVDNLLSNAIKYSSANTTVEVEFKGNDKDWEFTVRDYGMGMSKHDQKHLFKEFFRGENAVNSKVIGSGVGLLLVKNIVNLHLGTISFTSEENQGSVFSIKIPYKKVDAKYVDVYDNQNSKDLINIDSENELNDSFEIKSKKQKILVVEDNTELLRFLRLAFTNEYDVLTAANGVEAWELIQNEMPDLVVSDVMMPVMGGFELCKLMKTTFETSHIPLILLSALDENAMLLHGLGIGADDYITKPFNTDFLHHKIRSLINNRIAIREKAMRIIQSGNEEPVLSNNLNDQFLKKMLEVVTNNMSNPRFGKDDFASSMKISGSLLYKKSKALTNLSPVEFVKSVRMGKSLELIKSKKYSIAEISDMCGYESPGYFSTVFKKYYGKSPSEI